jgi:asparagine synthase (glutamine-hydrolysing)
MCGFAGFLGGRDTPEIATDLLANMGNTIAHRGPDDHGHWYDATHGIGLSHRRLAIVDLSPAGHQPMLSTSKRYVIAFNGEIYNHLQLREQLIALNASIHWRGHSDTETILAAFECWGIQQAIEKFVGMFSIAVWDSLENQLTLARDRMGEKPLYYGWNRGVFLFGSELKALRAHPAFDSQISRDALALYMQYSYVPAPYSIYGSVRKLPPGCILQVSLDKPGTTEVKSYWSLQQRASEQQQLSQEHSESEVIDQLHQLIKGSVQSQMMSDVPIGAFLSGGVDSSLIVAVMQSLAPSPVKTFTIGFEQQEFDEAHFAAKVAAHIGTDHAELYLTNQDALNVVPQLATIYDEPFADSSQIPTYLVSALARKHVTVALSGDAGDELFAGYTRYQHCAATWSRLQQSSAMTRWLVSQAGQLSPFAVNKLSHLFNLKPEGRNLGNRLTKMSAAMQAADFVSYYQSMITHTTFVDKLVLNSQAVQTVFTELNSLPPTVESLMLVDSLSYLPDDILAKVDRASMAVSLESRIPLLDYRIVEFAQKMPLHLKVKSGQTKWCLRQILDSYVPRHLIERPKKGFGVPLAAWLRGPLKSWAEDLLDPQVIKQQQFFDAKMIEQMWYQHQSGIADWHFQLWNILVFQQWLGAQNAA